MASFYGDLYSGDRNAALTNLTAIVTITLELLKVLYRVCRSSPILLKQPSIQM
ncbi:hypothetical protein [Nostoc sp.]|uniref:hypothetical protein n=1 Tax=Nostoc sp. TaxID=1180 RepID=UPI002FFD32AC